MAVCVACGKKIRIGQERIIFYATWCKKCAKEKEKHSFSLSGYI